MMRVKIGRNQYLVDLDSGKVFNNQPGKKGELKNPEKIQSILNTANRLLDSRKGRSPNA